MQSGSRRLFAAGTTYDAFWVATLRDISGALRSVREHGGFAHLCRNWRQHARTECLSAVNELITILNEWKAELEQGPQAAALATGSATVEGSQVA